MIEAPATGAIGSPYPGPDGVPGRVSIAALVPIPEHARPAAFLVGIGIASALALAGGLRARRALLEGTTDRIRAFASAWAGLLLGVTGAVFCAWSAVGLLL